MDDFCASGEQAAQFLETLSEAFNSSPVLPSQYTTSRPLPIGFLFAVGFDDALRDLTAYHLPSVDIHVCAGRVLTDSDRAFRVDSSIYPRELRKNAKRLLVDIAGLQLEPNSPRGYKDVESLVVFGDNCPDNTLPAIHRSGLVNSRPWRPLFERADP